MPLLIFIKPLAKSFIPAHTRRTKDGKVIFFKGSGLRYSYPTGSPLP